MDPFWVLVGSMVDPGWIRGGSLMDPRWILSGSLVDPWWDLVDNGFCERGAGRHEERATRETARRMLRSHWADRWAHLVMAYVPRRRQLYRGAALRERSRRLSGPAVGDRESAVGDRAGGGRRRNSDAVMRGVMWVARWLPCGKSPMRP